MATTTPNLGLTLPGLDDQADIAVLNQDYTLIDTAVGTLNGKIAQINDTTTFSVTENDTYTDQFVMVYYKRGSIVYISGFLHFKSGVTCPKDTTLFTIPAGYRPIAEFTSIAAKVQNGAISPEIAIVKTNGTVCLHNGDASPGGSYVRMNIMYPAVL